MRLWDYMLNNGPEVAWPARLAKTAYSSPCDEALSSSSLLYIQMMGDYLPAKAYLESGLLKLIQNNR